LGFNLFCVVEGYDGLTARSMADINTMVTGTGSGWEGLSGQTSGGRSFAGEEGERLDPKTVGLVFLAAISAWKA